MGFNNKGLQRSVLLMLSVACMGLHVVTAQTPFCPCSNPQHCQLIKSPARKEDVNSRSTSFNGFFSQFSHEVFVFRVGESDDWKRFDWSRITTIIPFSKYQPEIMCYAHSKGARFVHAAGFPVGDLSNATFRSHWVYNQVNIALNGHMDGINIDFEAPLKESEAHFLVALVNETATAFRGINPHAQISFDTPYAAGCTWGRCYDYKNLAQFCDFLVLMNYDLGIAGIASPNDPIQQFKQGLQSFEKIGIPADKLVLAFPWYGYDYQCNGTLKDNVCSVSRVSKQRKQVWYSKITQMLQNFSTEGILNSTYVSKFFVYKDRNTSLTHQLWYDDPETLTVRYQYAKQYDVRGVAMWQADCLDYSLDPEAIKLTKAMWNAIDQFIR